MTIVNQFDFSSFIGKTIATVENTAVNAFVIRFTDGTELQLETEYVGTGIYGIAVEAAQDN